MTYQVKAKDEATNEPVLLKEFENRKMAEDFALRKTFDGTRAWIEKTND